MADFLSRLFGLEKIDVVFTRGIRTTPPDWDPYRDDETFAQMTSGQLLASHYWLSPELQALVEDDDVLTIYLYRDPRDVLISIANYFKYANIHVVFYPYFSILSDEEAITTLITGACIPSDKIHLPEGMTPEEAVKHVNYEGIKYFCRQARPWLSHPNVHPLRFEDFSANVVDTIYKLFRDSKYEVSQDRIRKIHETLNFFTASGGRRLGNEEKTSHFRNGMTGQYKTVLSECQKNLCKFRIGNDLIQMGYESDLDW